MSSPQPLPPLVPLSPQEFLRLCAAAPCAPSTLRKYLTGKFVQPGSRQRIERAARELGLMPADPRTIPRTGVE